MISTHQLKHLLRLKRGQYQHLNKIEVSAEALRSNYRDLRKLHPEAEIAPVLKSNAYGHGLTIVAKALDKVGAPFFVVDSLYEAYELYKLGIKTKILIIGCTKGENFTYKKLPFEYAVYDLSTASALNKYQPGCNIHLFIDTGMNREGVPLSNFGNFALELKKYSSLNITGVCSHLSSADKDLNTTTQNQINNFKKVLNILKKNGIDPKWRHISASAGAYTIHDQTFNLIRAGLAIYGINPLDNSESLSEQNSLIPALSFVSTIVQTKTLTKGDSIGYNATFIAKKSMTVGLIPAGYYEGVDRRLSNKGFVKMGDKFCPVLGLVSMNLTVIDLSSVPQAKVGDRALIYSNIESDSNSIKNVSQLVKTIPYEILVHLASSVRRETVD